MHSATDNLKFFRLALALAVFFVPAMYAQVDTGAILGTVTDASGGVIPGAAVTITHQGTGQVLNTETRTDGSYIFRPIRIGAYTVEVSAKGFQKVRRADLTVQIQQQVLADFALSVGEMTQTVEVEATAPLLQTQNGSVGEVINSQTIVNMPLSTRNYNFLARLTAGVTHSQPEGRGLNSTGWFVANGTRPAQNNFMLDGIDNNSNNVDFLSGAAYVLKPPVDAIGEFKLQTNSFSAEFGRAGGAVLNASLKSGTNAFHGTAWEFLRNDKMDAADFFQNANKTKKGAFKQNQFGGAIGGPIVKNKLFFFGDYEGTRVRQAQPWGGLSVPTLQQRNSNFTDFSDLITLQKGSRGPDRLGRTVPLGTVFDPASTRLVTAGQVDPVTGITAASTGAVRDPFPGNIIPGSRLSPTAIGILKLFPAPTAAGLVGNYSVNRGNVEDTNAFDTRVDYNISQKDLLFGRFSWSDSPRFRPGPFEGVADGGGFAQGNESVKTQGAAVSYTHTFNPTFINETRIGYNREHVYRVQPFGDDTSDIPGKFGVPGITQTKGNGGLPYFGISGLSGLGSSGWLVSERFSNTYQLSNNLTKIWGSHTLKGGAEYQYIAFPWAAPPTSRGSFNANGSYTSMPNFGDGSTGRAQFLISPVSSGVPGGVDMVGGMSSVGYSNFGGVDNDKYYWGAYIQDDWKVSRKLTLNLGLRYDFFSLVGERYGAQANFIPSYPTPQFVIPANRDGDPRLSDGFKANLAADGIKLNYTDEFGSGLGLAKRLNLAPRFGYAYQVNSKLVLRGGFGMFYGAFENRGGWPNLGYNYPFQFDFNFPQGNDYTPVRYGDGQVATLERGVLSIPLDTTKVSGAGLNLRGIEWGYKTPYTMGANFTIQYELAPNNSIEAGYVNTLGRNLETFAGTNLPGQILVPGTNANNYIPFRKFARGSSYATTNATSNYHALQTKFTRRLSKGLDFLVAYTWAKTITNAGDLLSGGNVSGFRAPGLPGFGIKYDSGLAAFDVRHAFSASGTYQLPFGRGRSHMSGINKLADAFVGGWDMNFILALYSGQPQSIGCTVATTSGMGCWPLVKEGADLYVGKVEQFYNPDAYFNPPVATTIGQSDTSPLGGGKTPVTGPPFKKLDFSIFKQFQTTEKTRLEFRAETFNLTNTPSFANPGNTNWADKVNFGRIFSTRNNPNAARQVQLALKFYF